MCTIIINPTRDRQQKIVNQVAKGFRLMDSSEHLIIGAFPDEETPRVYDAHGRSIISLGANIRASNIGPDSSPCEVNKIFDSPTSLNGTFIHIAVDTTSAVIISDRFGSICLFYAVSCQGELILSTGYQSLLKQLTKKEIGRIREEVVYEFLYMRRLFGDKTYHHNIASLPSACRMIFNFESKKLNYRTYWEPKSLRLSNSKDTAVVLAEALRESTQMYLSSNTSKFGLMLSGGLDSRALLSIGRDQYLSFTTATTENNEVRIAERLAILCESEHKYLKRPADYFARIFERAIVCSNAMTVFYESQFIGYLNKIAQEVDVVHMGLGLDIFFCGHYLPKYHPKLMGRPSLYFRARKILEGHEERDFIQNVSYRLKTSSLTDIMTENFNEHLTETLLHSIGKKMGVGRALGLSGYSLWEFMHLTDIGRHYSMLMAHSLKGKLDVQIPALENRLYDLAFTISPEMKLNWTVYRRALAQNSSQVMAIKNSNTNIRANRGLVSQTLYNIARGAIRRIAPQNIQGMPNYWERSWPLVRDDLNNEYMQERIGHMIRNGKINDLSLINPMKIEKIYAQHKNLEYDHGVLLGLLLTIEYGLLQEF